MINSSSKKPFPWAKINYISPSCVDEYIVKDITHEVYKSNKRLILDYEILVTYGEGWESANIFANLEKQGVWLNEKGEIIQELNNLTFAEVCELNKWTRM